MQETVEDFYGLCITQKVINEGGVLYAKDALDDIQLDAPGQFGDDLGRLVAPGVGEDQGDGLGVLVLQDHLDILAVRLADELKGLAAQGFAQAFHKGGCLLLAKGFLQLRSMLREEK